MRATKTEWRPARQLLLDPALQAMHALQVSQLHVHVTGRLQGDPSWPGPCYGAVPAKLLEASTAAGMVKALQDYFAAAKGRSSS